MREGGRGEREGGRGRMREGGRGEREGGRGRMMRHQCYLPLLDTPYPTTQDQGNDSGRDGTGGQASRRCVHYREVR